MHYLFGPEASDFQRGLAAIALSLLVCACGLCSLSSATAMVSIVQDNAATRQARPTSTLVPTFSPTATPTSTPATTPVSVPTLPPLPSLSETPTPGPAATVTELPVLGPATGTSPPGAPAQPAAVCDCGADSYNCDDFGGSNEAQQCYRHCLSVGAGDVHQLDHDGDGAVCEN